MKESYVEGLASHDGPESCVPARKGVREALTGVRAGRVLSREIKHLGREPEGERGAEAVWQSRRPHRRSRDGEAAADPARSQTPSTSGNTLHGNREIPTAAEAAREGLAAARIEKPTGVKR
jgi:hypothetical protein